MTTIEEINKDIETINYLHKKIERLKIRHPEWKKAFWFHPGSILNAYREGDITFKTALKYLRIK